MSVFDGSNVGWGGELQVLIILDEWPSSQALHVLWALLGSVLPLCVFGMPERETVPV